MNRTCYNGLDLPKLTTLATDTQFSNTFFNPFVIILESVFATANMTIRYAKSRECVFPGFIPFQPVCHVRESFHIHIVMSRYRRSSSASLSGIMIPVSLPFILCIPFITTNTTVTTVTHLLTPTIPPISILSPFLSPISERCLREVSFSVSTSPPHSTARTTSSSRSCPLLLLSSPYRSSTASSSLFTVACQNHTPSSHRW